MKHFLKTIIWAAVISLPSHALETQNIECATGEKLTLIDPLPFKIVHALKDRDVVYAQSSEGKLYSFAALPDNTLKRTQIFRLPVVGGVYNLMFPNSLELGRKPYCPNRWAVSRTIYENPDCTTVSLFEMTNCYPIEIRNRDPWLFPLFHYMHKGPQNMVGVDITAMDRWVVVSGYTPDQHKVFAIRELNYDLAGHNFLMHYMLPGGEWKPNRFFRRVASKIGVSQRPVVLPLPDWKIFPLPEGAEPHVLLRRITGKDSASPVVLDIPFNREGEHAYFDVERQNYVNLQQPHSIPRTLSWLSMEELNFVLATTPQWTQKASLNGVGGLVRLSSQEPVYGVFEDHKGHTTCIYAVLRTPLDFLLNRIRFVDERGKRLKLEVG